MEEPRFKLLSPPQNSPGSQREGKGSGREPCLTTADQAVMANPHHSLPTHWTLIQVSFQKTCLIFSFHLIAFSQEYTLVREHPVYSKLTITAQQIPTQRDSLNWKATEYHNSSYVGPLTSSYLLKKLCYRIHLQSKRKFKLLEF